MNTTWSFDFKAELITLTEDNSVANRPHTSSWVGKNVLANTSPMYGKYYWEIQYSNYYHETGLYTLGVDLNNNISVQLDGCSYDYDGNLYINGIKTPNFGSVIGNDTMCVAYDAKNGYLWFGINGIWQGGGNPSLGLNQACTLDKIKSYFPTSSLIYNDLSATLKSSLDDFLYDIPVGFLPLGSDIEYHFVGPDRFHNDIQSAIDAALSGDIIMIEPGVYVKTINIDKAITIKGLTNNPNNNDIVLSGTTLSVRVMSIENILPEEGESAHIIIEGITILDNTDTWRGCLSVNNCNERLDITINRCILDSTRPYQYPLQLDTDTKIGNVIITNCNIIRGYAHILQFHDSLITYSELSKCVLNNTFLSYLSDPDQPNILNYVTEETFLYGVNYGSFLVPTVIILEETYITNELCNINRIIDLQAVNLRQNMSYMFIEFSNLFEPMNSNVSGEITGVVTIRGIIAKRKVWLFLRENMKLLQSTWSDPLTGEYIFSGLSKKKAYLVLSDDYAKNYNSVALDWLKASGDN